jgi:glycerol-3-phosphate dehydrogenase
MSKNAIYDMFIVGGGINGTGIAADAVGRGLTVMLAEMSDLASGTSSASSKLIHGGLRYLEYNEFRLVREALAEREVLMRKAPHLIWPLRFVLPHVPGVRPKWMVRAGLFLYDHLHSRQQIPGSSSIDLATAKAGLPLKSEFDQGFTYWDCWVDDARLVVLNAKAARNGGAQVLTRTRVVACVRDATQWRIELQDAAGRREVRARVLVNAAGPWVDGIDGLAKVDRIGPSAAAVRSDSRGHVRLIKGSHLVVPRIPGADDAYLMQSTDKRVVFVLPFEERFTIIGTTDVAYSGNPADVAASAEEEAYLLRLAGQFFKAPLRREDVLWRYSGVRPLYDDASADPSAVTRDYHLSLDAPTASAPMLSIYGGKVTTYRRLAEEALGRLAPFWGPNVGRAWTASVSLPGGDIADGAFEPFVADKIRRYPAFDPLHVRRLARRHGGLLDDVMGDARCPKDMGADLFGGLTAREVTYMKTYEWATRADDVLWRRTKLGLHALATLDTEQQRALEDRVAGFL